MRFQSGAEIRAEAARRRSAKQLRRGLFVPHLGSPMLALREESLPLRAWDASPVDDRKLAKILDELPSPALHDRVDPDRPQVVVDHLVVTRSGVVMIDTKRHRGRIDVGTRRLAVGGRDTTEAVHTVAEQAETVRRVVGDRAPVLPCLCFVDGDAAFLGGYECRGVQVAGPKGLRRFLRKLDAAEPTFDVDELSSWLTGAFPPIAEKIRRA